MEEQKRQTAYKVWVKDLIQGKYYVEEGWSPNYVLVYGKKISRVNVLATIVNISGEEDIQQHIFVDDGSAEIAVRSFNEIDVFRNLKVGDPLQIIGKIREYNGEKYIVPEILRKVDDVKWLTYRKIELEKLQVVVEETNKTSEDEKPEISSEQEEVLGLVRNLDSGDGADFEDVIKKSKLQNAEEILNNLLMNGEVFELKPGRLKVLD
ncbi:hypothetical protein KY328_02425 [Candidatus Woesearchaeota archaeon]|nr:hypothetical protein [Candidatus Woesearchaeota archaeon]MBW3021747.1 hypothetical protein [Candidatus Woesearchaeota archaeon]